MAAARLLLAATRTLRYERLRIFRENRLLCCGWIVRDYGFAASASTAMKVAIVNANGSIGKSLALCLKQSPLIDELALFDSRPLRGLTLELTHMDTRCKTRLWEDVDEAPLESRLQRTLLGAKIVAIVSEKTALKQEAENLEKLIVPGLLCCCPKAFVALISSSVNSLLPILFELYKRSGVFECNRLFGCLALYATRANSFAADTLNVDPEFVRVPIIGGGTSRTCVPLFSQTKPCAEFTLEELSRLMQSMRGADQRVAETQAALSNQPISAASHEGSNAEEASALCAGFSAARFCISLCKALRDEPGVQECAYVRSCLVPELKYFGTPLELGPCGIQKHLGVPGLTSQECRALYSAIPEIKRAIELGESMILGERCSSEVCPVPPRCTALQPCQPNVTV